MTVLRSQCKDDTEYRTALRDDFAAAALQGFLTNATAYSDEQIPGYASQCYSFSDAMLKEREKIKPTEAERD